LSSDLKSWPIVITDGELTLRPLRYRDRAKWLAVRARNREWLSPWEATAPLIEERNKLPTYLEMVAFHNREGRAGRSVSLTIWIGQDLIGQITLGGIAYGAQRGAHIGYWIDKEFANRGITTRAVQLVTRFAFDRLRLQRIEIALRPENGASKRVAEKAGYQFEALRPRYLHIDGDWRDHIVFVAENPKL
jgi:ribosomal-protein-alanine N-acetyltransferase